ncbi:hypothetical protein V5O48_002677 [Marasmius crinis-equi]|uniref:A-kinase anchor protein 7-like phosphoesterase domain-containing protein n=1 Tax=Marasmius crinis-equi TaxID=585013 RepID=A0ABR3FVK1_9AGAR
MNEVRIGHAAAGASGNFRRGNQRRVRGERDFANAEAGNSKEASRPSNPGQSEKRPPRPTHFLSLPLGQYPELRDNVGKFQDALLRLDGTPSAIKGLHQSIIINPRRLHLTLGVMALQKPSEGQDGSDTTPRKTVESALNLLHSLQPQLLKEGPVQIPLRRLGAFENKKGARVLWVSPIEHSEDGETSEEKENREKLARVCNLVHRAFRDAGYLTDQRPLKLHCTLINTSHRKPSSKRHVLFSYDDILVSQALRDINVFSAVKPSARVAEAEPSSLKEVTVVSEELLQSTAEGASMERLIQVDMGSYTVPDIQLCVMGSHGREGGEYISVGGISLADQN